MSAIDGFIRKGSSEHGALGGMVGCCWLSWWEQKYSLWRKGGPCSGNALLLVGWIKSQWEMREHGHVCEIEERSTYHFQLRRFYPIILILLHVSDVYCQNFPQVLSCLLFCFALFSHEMTWWTQALNFRVVKLIHLLKVSTLHFTWKTLPEKRKVSTYTFFFKVFKFAFWLFSS